MPNYTLGLSGLCIRAARSSALIAPGIFSDCTSSGAAGECGECARTATPGMPARALKENRVLPTFVAYFRDFQAPRMGCTFIQSTAKVAFLLSNGPDIHADVH